MQLNLGTAVFSLVRDEAFNGSDVMRVVVELVWRRGGAQSTEGYTNAQGDVKQATGGLSS